MKIQRSLLQMASVLFILMGTALAQAAECSGGWRVIPNYRPERGAPCAQLGLDTHRGTCVPGQAYEVLCDDASGGRYRTCPGDRRCDRYGRDRDDDGDHRRRDRHNRDRWERRDDDDYWRYDDRRDDDRYDDRRRYHPRRWDDYRSGIETIDFCRVNGPIEELHGPKHQRIAEIQSQIERGRLALEYDRRLASDRLRHAENNWQRKDLQHDFETRRECFEGWREQMDNLRAEIEREPERHW